MLAFACGLESSCAWSGPPTRADAFERCVFPLCASDVCANGGSTEFARTFCSSACLVDDSKARFESFGGSWATSAFNPLNIGAALSGFAYAYPNAASMIRIFSQVQTTIMIIRAILEAVQGTGGGSTFGG